MRNTNTKSEMRKLRINNWSFWLLGVLLAWLLPSSAWGEKADWENLPAIKVNCTGRNGSLINPMQIRVHIEAEGKVYWIRPGGDELEVTGNIINETYYANGEPHDYSLRGNFKKVHLTLVNNCTIHSVVAEKCDKLVEFYLHVAVEKTIGLTNCPLLPKMTFTDQVETFTATDCSKLTTIEGGAISEKLDLDNCAVSTIPSCVTTTKYLDIKNCANLTKIEAKENGRLDDVKVKNCSTLTSIDVANSGTSSFYLTINNCPQLKRIDNVDRLSKVTITNCANLEKLDTDNASKLHHVIINGCDKLEKINGKNFLKFFEATSCQKLATLEGMNALEGLTLSHCAAITKLTAWNALKSMSAKNCDKLATVEAKNASRLTSIELSNCSGVTLTASNWELRIYFNG